MATAPRHRKPWDDAERARLDAAWKAGDRIATIARALERSPRAVYSMAKDMGIPVGCPEGFEYLTHAADRVGLANVAELRRVLGWAKVRIHAAHSRGGVNQWRRHFVAPAEVDEAIARWCRSESVTCAARRHGVSTTTMYKWLRKVGVDINRRGAGCMWRLDPDVVDKAAHRAALRRELGNVPLCHDCNNEPRVEGRTRCVTCGERNAQRTAAWQLQRFYDSKCVRCGRANDTDGRRCAMCCAIDKENREAA